MAVYRRTSRRRSVLILLVLTSITLITLDTRANGGGVTGSVRDAVRDAVAPAQDAVDDALSPVADWFDGVTSSGDLKRENARLRRELEAARGRANAARAAIAQNRELTELEDLTFVEGLDSVVAQITAASPGNFEETVGLNRGTDAGIVAGNPVVAGDGLVGRVASASGQRATVLMLTDPRSGVSVRLEGSGAAGVVNGRAGRDLLALEFLQPENVEVKKGEMVFTSGLEPSRFPPGIPVGKVVSVRRTPGALTQRIMVRPLADVGRLSFVRVLDWPAGPAEPGG